MLFLASLWGGLLVEDESGKQAVLKSLSPQEQEHKNTGVEVLALLVDI